MGREGNYPISFGKTKKIENCIFVKIYYLKYRGSILCVTSLALGSDDLTLDQSAMSIQILPEPALVT